MALCRSVTRTLTRDGLTVLGYLFTRFTTIVPLSLRLTLAVDNELQSRILICSARLKRFRLCKFRMNSVVVCTGLMARESEGLTLTPNRLKMSTVTIVESSDAFDLGVKVFSDEVVMSKS